jgi:hypothetical protein
LVRKLGGRRPLERLTHGCEDNTTMDFKGKIFEGMDWIHLAQDRDQMQALVSTVTHLRVP